MSKIIIEPEGKGRNPVPSPFELSVIATLLAKGKKKPEDKLEAAWDLFNEAQSLIYLQEEEFSDEVLEYRHREAEWEWEQKIKDYILFLPKEDWDPARQYLLDKKKPLKQSKSVKKNLKPLFIRLRPEEWSEKDAVQHFNKLMKKERVYLPPKYLKELVKDKRAKKSAGGDKSHKTRKSKSVKHRGKK